MTRHVCTLACGITFDAACPQWQLEGMPQASEADLRCEWERRDRAARRASALLRDDPELPGLLAELLGCAWDTQPSARLLGALRALVGDVLLDCLPAALDALDCPRGVSLRALVEEVARAERAGGAP